MIHIIVDVNTISIKKEYSYVSAKTLWNHLDDPNTDT